MAQQVSPFLEANYGWNFGEGGWNTGMDQNLLKFSFMFDGNVDSIVASLPPVSNGAAHFNSADNRFYFGVGTVWYSSPCPKSFIFKIKSNGHFYQFNGTSAVKIDNPSETDSRLDAVELTVASLGTAAFQSVEFFATQAELDVAAATAATYTDTLRTDVANTATADKGAALVGFDGTTLDQQIKLKISRVVDSITDLKSLDKTKYTKAFVTGYYTVGDGGGGAYYLDAADTTSVDNGGTIIVATDGGRWKLQHSDKIDVRQFGVVGDGITDNTTKLEAIRAYAALSTESGNVIKINFPAGRYVYTVSPNWAISRLHINFDGEVWMINSGVGASFILDGGATGPGVYGIQITGIPLIHGAASSQQGVYVRAIYKSWLSFNVRSAGAAFAGLHMEWCVSNVIRYVINANEGGLATIPARGLYATNRGVAEETSYNYFENIECTGVPVGIYLDGALGNMFVGGAVQGCTNVGVQQTANAWENKFFGTDFEVNTVRDAEVASREAQFYGCDFEKGVVFQNGAVNGSVIGGTLEQITVEAGAVNTLYSGVTYNRFGTGVITDAGTRTRFSDIRNKGTGEISNVPRAKIPVTVGASPFTYTNTTGNQQTVLVTGGVVSQVAFVRFAGEVVPTSGFVELSPGDSVTVTYSSLPAVVVYTR